ncbi:class I SAM-dependent methyltransferase [Polymorphospora sp. NPDC050346]|uniref:class I SAM-dependent methyltransferase n=1 Tax=Polymorphospora sp. NPDC050346 TaxID=3155780 RepID=UPI0033FF48AE
MASVEFKHPQIAPVFTGAFAAHATVLADDLGLFRALADTTLTDHDLDRPPWVENRIRIEGVLNALCRIDAVRRTADAYRLTDFGLELGRQAPVFRLWLGGYASVLADQISGAVDPRSGVRGGVVAESSSQIGSRYIDETFIQLVDSLQPAGRICDLGCGTGRRLLKICRETGQPGLGYDISADAIRAAQATVAEARGLGIDLEINQGDATTLPRNVSDVDIVTQAFMTHHIAPDDYCTAVLASYRVRFPGARYLVVFDTVSSSDPEHPELFAPGFDYIHALQNMEPRSRADALRIFDEAGYSCQQELELAVPNSYAWVLKFGSDGP